MAWSWTKRGESGGHSGDAWTMEEQPESKRRKVSLSHRQQQQVRQSDDVADDWGDDSLELTQADLETLDVMASQVMTQGSSHSNPRAESFVKPNMPVKSSTNRSSSSSDSSIRPNSSSSLSNSLSSSSSHSSYNGFAQSLKNSSSRKLDSTEALQSELEQTIRQAQEDKYRHDGELKYLRESIHKQELELEKLRAVRDEANDQQKQAQSEKERHLQLQVESLISQAHFKDREYQELQQMYKTIQLKLKAAERQGNPTSPSPGGQGSGLSDTERIKPSSPKKVAVKPSPPSKLKQQQRQKEDEQLGSSQRQQFPTCSSFLEKTLSPVSPELSSPRKTKTSPDVIGAQKSEEAKSKALKEKKERRLKLNAVCPERQGSELLRATLQPCREPGGQPDPGLPSLLHAMFTSLTLGSLSFGRVKDSSFLTPFNQKRPILTQVSGSHTETTDSHVQVVSEENFRLALQGMEILLGESGIVNEDPRVKFYLSEAGETSTQIRRGGNIDDDNGTSRTRTERSSLASSLISSSLLSAMSESKKDCGADGKIFSLMKLLGSNSHQAGAVLLLPMLCDYLHHYLDLLHSSHSKRVVNTANTTPVSVALQSSSSVESLPLYTSSCSYDSSLDSLSSSVLQLIQEGRMYANAVERHAVSSLCCLNILIQLCPSLISVIARYSPSSSTSSPSATAAARTSTASAKVTADETKAAASSTSMPSRNKQESGSDADDEKSTSSSEVRIIRGPNPTQSGTSPVVVRHSNELTDQSTILCLAIAFAGEDVEDGNINPEVVEESLRLLTQLCYHCGDHQLTVLESIIDRGILSSAFRHIKHPPILLEGQKLCQALVCHFDLISKLCSKSETCPLYLMCRLCSTHRLDDTSPAVIKIYSQHISFLSTMSLQHRNGLCAFVINSCLCSEELVVSVILGTHKIFAMYTQDPPASEHLLKSLMQAVVVLHSLAQGDTAFIQHQAPVQLTYARLLSRMAAVFKPLRSEWEWHVSALEELCDVEPELNESSQDSDGDDRMDVS